MLFINRQYAASDTPPGDRAGLRRSDAEPRRSGRSCPFPSLNRAVVRALNVARSITDDVSAVFISEDPDQSADMRTRWDRQVPGVPLVIVESPYRALAGPLMAYLDVLDRAWPPDKPEPITFVVIPEYVARHWWERILYNQSAQRLRSILLGPAAHGRGGRPVPARRRPGRGGDRRACGPVIGRSARCAPASGGFRGPSGRSRPLPSGPVRGALRHARAATSGTYRTDGRRPRSVPASPRLVFGMASRRLRRRPPCPVAKRDTDGRPGALRRADPARDDPPVVPQVLLRDGRGPRAARLLRPADRPGGRGRTAPARRSGSAPRPAAATPSRSSAPRTRRSRRCCSRRSRSSTTSRCSRPPAPGWISRARPRWSATRTATSRSSRAPSRTGPTAPTASWAGGRSRTSSARSRRAPWPSIAVGSCAFDGGAPAASGGLTDAKGIRGLVGDTKLITLPGCPMNVVNLTAVIVHYLTFREWPALRHDGPPAGRVRQPDPQPVRAAAPLRVRRVRPVLGRRGRPARLVPVQGGLQGPRGDGQLPDRPLRRRRQLERPRRRRLHRLRRPRTPGTRWARPTAACPSPVPFFPNLTTDMVGAAMVGGVGGGRRRARRGHGHPLQAPGPDRATRGARGGRGPRLAMRTSCSPRTRWRPHRSRTPRRSNPGRQPTCPMPTAEAGRRAGSPADSPPIAETDAPAGTGER